MRINSLEFIGFIIITVILYYLIPKKGRFLVLLASSYIFYYLASSNLIIYILASTVSIYLGGILIDKQNKKISKDLEKEEKKKLKKIIKTNKKRITFWTVLFNFALLVGLKYSPFLETNINYLLKPFDYSIPVVKLILPLGISYYTLMAVSYIVDVNRGVIKADYNFFRVALYLVYFPHITEGPIGKYDKLAKELYEGHKFKLSSLKYGTLLILFGYFKKMVIADRAAIFVNDVFASNNGGLTIILAGILYTIQIYFEFSGCMDIVRGTSELFNVHLEKNFTQPFFSKSIAEFWRRWHITLGAWIKDYIFYPISLSKFNMKVTSFVKKVIKNEHFKKFIITAFPLLFVWLFNGIWHGASFKYIAYGMYYYLIMMLGLLCLPISSFIKDKLKIKDKNKLYTVFCMLRTSSLVVIGMMLFRAKSLHSFATMIKSIFIKPYTGIMNHGLNFYDFLIILFGILILFVLGILKENKISVYKKFKKQNVIFKYLVYVFLFIMIVIFGIYGEGYSASDFIYGAF